MIEKVKVKKPFYKKWWFITLLALFIIGALGTIFESDESKQQRIEEELAAEQAAEGKAKEREKERELARVEKEKKKEAEKIEKELAEKKKEEEKAKAEEVIPVTAMELYNAYQDNEIAADLKFKDKLVKVTGVISDFGVDIAGRSYVLLDTGGPFKDTQVFFQKGEEEKLAELSKGQTITAVGKGGGLIITKVVINKAELK